MNEPTGLRRINLVVVPRMGRSFYNIVVSYHLAYFLLVAGILGIGINIFLLSGYVGLKQKMSRVRHLESVNSEVQTLIQDAEAIRKDLDKVREIDRRIQAKTGITGDYGYIDSLRDEGSDSLPSRGYTPDIEAVRERLRILRGEVETRKEMASSLEERIDGLVEKFATIPSVNPVRNGKINSGFGYRTHPITGGWEFHEGIDIEADTNTPVYATADGVVAFSGWWYGYGLAVVIDHGTGFTTVYAHNSRNLVRPGEKVKKGQIISYAGSTGSTTGTHVHYEVRYDNQLKNPTRFLSLTYKDIDRIAALKNSK